MGRCLSLWPRTAEAHYVTPRNRGTPQGRSRAGQPGVSVAERRRQPSASRSMLAASAQPPPDAERVDEKKEDVGVK